MVAHPRKTPSLGALRPIASGTVAHGAASPGAISSEIRNLQFRSLNLPAPNPGLGVQVGFRAAKLGAKGYVVFSDIEPVDL